MSRSDWINIINDNPPLAWITRTQGNPERDPQTIYDYLTHLLHCVNNINRVSKTPF